MSRRRSSSSPTKPRRRQPPVAATRVPEPAGGDGRRHADSGRAESVEPEALVVTYVFDSGDRDEDQPHDVTVRFTGRRVGVSGVPKAGDSFSKDETIEGLVPGTGPVSLTAWIYGLRPGEWTVDARVIRGLGAERGKGRARTDGVAPIQPAMWSWRRWRPMTTPARPVKTRWALLAPLARQPAVIPGIYTALAVAGFVLALALQTAILARSGIDAGPPLAASVIAIVAGLTGAKVWYAFLHPDESLIKGGWAVDGFLVVAPLVAAVTLFTWNVPIGRVLDATTPGIFFAVALGRIGCFLTGCCAGRCTASRWGIWSSDRRVGARRIPTQLLESAAGLAIGLLTLALVLAGGLLVPGVVFVVAFAVYAAIRQALLRLRAERRKSPRTVPLTAVAQGLVVAAVATLGVLQAA